MDDVKSVEPKNGSADVTHWVVDGPLVGRDLDRAPVPSRRLHAAEFACNRTSGGVIREQ